MGRNQKLAELLFPNVHDTVEDLLRRYPVRSCPAMRFAPSPTGYLHIGNLMSCNIVSRVATVMGGKYLLRIEDTDQKREVQGAVGYLVNALKKFGIEFDEGFDGERDFGNYGPYVQSKRVHLYHVFAKRMVELGRAYPCFCTEQQLSEIRKKQENEKQKTGYYGEAAACKRLRLEDVERNIKAGVPWVLRFNAQYESDEPAPIVFDDPIKGRMTLPAEVNNPVIIKSDGIPPYNFAHVVDDTLMRISHVTRGDEWLVSTAEHIQLFRAMELPHPVYCHLPALCVEENGSKRKISKRKDKIALVDNFINDGYPVDAIIEYLLCLSNSNFEPWRIANPTRPYTEFAATIEKIGSNSPLFDFNKLNDISKNVVAVMTCAQVNNAVESYYKSQTANPEREGQARIVLNNIRRVFAVLAIDRETPKPRKDIVKFSDIYELYHYMFDEVFDKHHPILTEQERQIARQYAAVYNPHDTKEQWFERLKAFAVTLDYAPSVKEFKQNPTSFKGHVGDVARIVRLAVTGQENSPDLYAILNALGSATVGRRLL